MPHSSAVHHGEGWAQYFEISILSRESNLETSAPRWVLREHLISTIESISIV